MENKYIGTLAIDIGNTNTVVAFQDEIKQEPILIDIPDITIIKGVVPSALWYEENKDESKIGLMALNEMKCQNNKKQLVVIKS